MKSLGFVLLSLFAINSYAQSIHDRLIPPLVGAHRGGNSVKGTNNTVEKFVNAVKAGADIIETDLQATKDGVVMIYHDADLSTDSSCSGKISDKYYNEIKDCKLKGSKRINTFEEALIAVNGKAVINAEFKTMYPIVPAIKLVQKYNAYSWVYFQTQGNREKYFLARQTDNKVALLYKTTTVQELDWILSQDDYNLVVIEMEKEMATPENIQKVHNHYKLVSVNSWRYGSMEELFSAACDKVFKLGIDIAIANNIQSCIRQKKSILGF